MVLLVWIKMLGWSDPCLLCGWTLVRAPPCSAVSKRWVQPGARAPTAVVAAPNPPAGPTLPPLVADACLHPNRMVGLGTHSKVADRGAPAGC